jgi:hypothetical protein
MKKRVICVNVDEDVANWGGNTNPKGILTVGKKYTIIDEDVHSWHTKVYLDGFPDMAFNSCHFEAVK